MADSEQSGLAGLAAVADISEYIEDDKDISLPPESGGSSSFETAMYSYKQPEAATDTGIGAGTTATPVSPLSLQPKKRRRSLLGKKSLRDVLNSRLSPEPTRVSYMRMCDVSA